MRNVKEWKGQKYFELQENENGKFDCPFCRREHTHGKSTSGHRLPHCMENQETLKQGFPSDILLRGYLFKWESGYLIKTIHKKP